jgi:hypothetical protein
VLLPVLAYAQFYRGAGVKEEVHVAVRGTLGVCAR